MITVEDYKKYFGVDTAPGNLKRLEYLSLNNFRSIMINNIPATTDIIYQDFKKALMEQINYFVENPELIESSGSSGYSLGSYSESGSNNSQDNSKSTNRTSPMAYDILMSIGLLCSVLI